MSNQPQERHPSRRKREVTKNRELDKAVEQTFPASDPTAPGHETAREKPARPADRKAPVISREDVERARKSGGRK